jgi:hypothetical protein
VVRAEPWHGPASLALEGRFSRRRPEIHGHPDCAADRTIIVVLTEMLRGGRGSMIMYAGRFADIKTVLVGVIAASLMGYATIKLFELLRRRLLAWHQETSVTA